LKLPSRLGSLFLDDLRLELDDGIESDRLRALAASLSPVRFERLESDILNRHRLLLSASRQTAANDVTYASVVAKLHSAALR
jgi:hypothetical protein